MRKVLIVDDSKMFRKILKKIVQGHFQVAGEAGDGNEGFKEFERLRPDVTFLDITMPNCDGRECLEKILKNYPSSKIIMITGIDNVEVAQECLGIGAKGYINKNSIDVSSDEAISQTLTNIQSFLGE